MLAELDRREADSESFIRPQRRHADIVVSFIPGESQDPDELDAHMMLGPGLPHPDLSTMVTDEPGGIAIVDQGADRGLKALQQILRARAIIPPCRRCW